MSISVQQTDCWRFRFRKCRSGSASGCLGGNALLWLRFAEWSDATESVPVCGHPSIDNLLYRLDSRRPVNQQRQARTHRSGKRRIHRLGAGEHRARRIQPPAGFGQAFSRNSKSLGDSRLLHRLSTQPPSPVKTEQAVARTSAHPAFPIEDQNAVHDLDCAPSSKSNTAAADVPAYVRAAEFLAAGLRVGVGFQTNRSAQRAGTQVA